MRFPAASLRQRIQCLSSRACDPRFPPRFVTGYSKLRSAHRSGAELGAPTPMPLTSEILSWNGAFATPNSTNIALRSANCSCSSNSELYPLILERLPTGAVQRDEIFGRCGHCVSDRLIGPPALRGHPRKYGNVYIHIVIYPDLMLSSVQTMQPTCILCDRTLPGNRHREEQSVETRIVKSFTQIATG